MTKSSPDRPPRISAAILAWLLHDDWQTPAGDFEEAFHHRIDRDGVRAARRWYRLRVLRLVPDRLTEKLIWNSAMFVTNLNISVRTLRRNPGFAAINMGGLAVGLAACILIMLFIKDELTFDAFHSNSDQIVRVVEEVVALTGLNSTPASAGSHSQSPRQSRSRKFSHLSL